MPNRQICIHGHFYQPPRENPWLNHVEWESSAAPYHDWNARIAAECYEPNTASRILDGDGHIVRIVNNFSRISFNLGPTLLAWLEREKPEVYQAILEADETSLTRFSGHGSAIAQAWGHIILPLSNLADIRTQVRWGLEDFRQRFGRSAEGMWLPETAVNSLTLQVLAEEGVKFTILAPHQASRIRSLNENTWKPLPSGGIDTTVPYEWRAGPESPPLALFFYDGARSQAVAFEGLLSDGEKFANRLIEGLSDPSRPQLVHIATDGESYGHHHRFGDMALAYALDYIERQPDISLTSYGEYLASTPPVTAVEIVENSSWSCAHGVERWRNDCGCKIDPPRGWSQGWRAPLREALDWLRDTIAPLFEEETSRYLRDPWQARDDYIAIMLDPSLGSREKFLKVHAHRTLTASERVLVWKLLEIERHALLMYTSCGWFFDDISGLESVQILRYAARTIDLAQTVFSRDFEEEFLERLALAPGNLPAYANGAQVYRKLVRPVMADVVKIGAHWAIRTLFEPDLDNTEIYGFKSHADEIQIARSGATSVFLGKVTLTAELTEEVLPVQFLVLHFGDHHLTVGAKIWREPFAALAHTIRQAFDRGDLAAIVHLVDQEFSPSIYTLGQLFPDDRQNLLEKILSDSLTEAESTLSHMYERHAPLATLLQSAQIPIPKVLSLSIEWVLNRDLERSLRAAHWDAVTISRILDESKNWTELLNVPVLAFAAAESLAAMGRIMQRQLGNLEPLLTLQEALTIAGNLPFDLDLRTLQTLYYRLAKRTVQGSQSIDLNPEWVQHFYALAPSLNIYWEATP